MRGAMRRSPGSSRRLFAARHLPCSERPVKTLADNAHALADGLAAIRVQYQVVGDFPPEVDQAAEDAARRVPSAHVDRTERPFVTLDPASSTDLDQAFAIERAGDDLILHYAIADVAWFVDDGGPIDSEAWKRGETQYLPDDKARLYPAVLSEGAASLLPDVLRPAVIFTTRVAPDGSVTLDGAERAVIRSRAKLAYDSVKDGDLPAGFAELSDRISRAEDARGAERVDPPQQEVFRKPDGSLDLGFSPRLESEDRNASLSLATNMAVADALFAHQTGLFRVMAEPDDGAIRQLRHTARAFGLTWPGNAPLTQFQKTLSPSDPRQAAFMLAIRRAGHGAGYVPYQPGKIPWHAAMAATYAHATAPLRRLADRYVVRAALAVANGQPVPERVAQAFDKLPPVMAHAEAIDGQIQRAIVDLAEALLLEGSEGQSFPAIVTDLDERGARIQLRDLPVVARVVAHAVAPGDAIVVKLTAIDPVRRSISFTRMS